MVKNQTPFSGKSIASLLKMYLINQLINRGERKRKMRKLLATLITAMMIVTFSIPAVASAAEKGSITINGVGADTTYEVYKLLDLESYDVDAGAYSYKVNSAWTGFFATETAVSIDASGYVVWNTAEDDDTVAAFAKRALAYAKAKGIEPVKSSEKDGDFVVSGTTGVFSGLELGYYLVDSTMGALCGLTTTNPNASINAKNGIPTIDKQVKEDSTNQWGDNNSADLGQIVEFRVTINVHAGAEKYVLHDNFSNGFTFINEGDYKVKVEHVIPGTGTHTTPAEKYNVVTSGLESECDLEVRFTNEFCDEMETNDKLVVYYYAVLNSDAVIAGQGNPNTAWLSFGEGKNSNEDTTFTYTYGIDIIKTDSQNKLIDGAQFKIYDAETGGNEVKVVLKDGEYIRNASLDNKDEPGVAIVVTDGQIRVSGFDNGTYYLEETVAPDGYNKLSARQKFIISDANLDAVFNDGIFSTGSGVHVVNKTGTMLPETGGMGTLLFTLIGGIAVLGAGIILFARRRVNQYE